MRGDELCSEWRKLQGLKTIELCVEFVEKYEELTPVDQKGEPTYYRRRSASDSQLDPDKTIREQFNLLRVVDNSRYPAYFELNGIKYKIKIEKME